MKVFAIYNMKGGVGKTATAVNLCYLAAAEGKRTLICDLDAQGSTSWYFRVKPKVKSGVKALVQGRKSLNRSIRETDYENLDLLPADFSYRGLDVALDNEDRSRRRLGMALDVLEDPYDYVFLDCPPNLTLLSENILSAANYVIIPLIPTTLSANTLERLVDFWEDSGKAFKKALRLPFFSMVDQRRTMHRELITEMKDRHMEILDTNIPYSSDVEKMGVHRSPVFCFKTHSPVTRYYRELWNEIKNRGEL